MATGSDQSYLKKIKSDHASSHLLTTDKILSVTFRVHHYAGVVDYTVTGFIEKNRDTLFDHLQEMLLSSTDPLIQALGVDPLTEKVFAKYR